LPLSEGFAPVADANARVLILGSLPGRKSLEMGQYYAQQQNSFWRIMGVLCGAAPALPYAERLERLRSCRVAVWDVLAAGERAGSLPWGPTMASTSSTILAAAVSRARKKLAIPTAIKSTGARENMV
jgi:hypoxanthine-DNA glycosylase